MSNIIDSLYEENKRLKEEVERLRLALRGDLATQKAEFRELRNKFSRMEADLLNFVIDECKVFECAIQGSKLAKRFKRYYSRYDAQVSTVERRLRQLESEGKLRKYIRKNRVYYMPNIVRWIETQ